MGGRCGWGVPGLPPVGKTDTVQLIPVTEESPMSLRASAYRLGGYLAARQPVSAKKHQIGTYQHLPPKVDLRPWMTQVGNSCVANAFVGAYEYLAKQALGDAGDVSRLFVYYNARCQDGDDIQDRGTQMVSAIQALVEYGACTENTWPNDEP